MRNEFNVKRIGKKIYLLNTSDQKSKNLPHELLQIYFEALASRRETNLLSAKSRQSWWTAKLRPLLVIIGPSFKVVSLRRSSFFSQLQVLVWHGRTEGTDLENEQQLRLSY